MRFVMGSISQDQEPPGNPGRFKFGSATLSSYIALAKAGQHFTIAIDNGDITSAKVDARLNLAKGLLAAVPGCVTAIEGFNEIGNFGGSFNGVTGEAGAEAAQAYIYSKVHSDPVFVSNGVKVDYFTGYTTGSTDPSVTQGLADYDNQHSYPNGQAPAFYQDTATTLVNEPVAGPHVYTETGYSTAAGGVSAHDQGAYTLDLLADAAKGGSAHTDLYELLDAYAPGTPNGDSHYGLFDYANNPTLAAQGIHNLTALLKDDGSDATTFATKAVDVKLSGLPVSGNSLQLQTSDGTIDEMVWAEPGTGTTPVPKTVTASMSGHYDVTVYDPLAGMTPVATFSDVDSCTLQVTDHPLVAEMKTVSDGSPPPVTTDPGTGGSTTPPVTTVPAGGGTVTTPPGTTTPTGGDTGSTTTPPPTGTGSSLPPVDTDPGAGAGTTPVTTGGGSSTPVTTTPTTPATPAFDTGALTASITASVTAALHDQAVAHHDAVQAHDQAIAKANLETYVNTHSKVVRGDLLASAIVDALTQGGYRADRMLLQSMNTSGEAHTAGWFEHALGTGPQPTQVFLDAVKDAHAAHQGGAS